MVAIVTGKDVSLFFKSVGIIKTLNIVKLTFIKLRLKKSKMFLHIVLF